MNSSALLEVKKLLPQLSPGELQQVAQWLTEHVDSIPGIEKTPGICGGSACIIRTRIPVWLLVEAKKAGATNAHLLASFSTLRQEDLDHAWAYYMANMAEIDQEIQENTQV